MELRSPDDDWLPVARHDEVAPGRVVPVALPGAPDEYVLWRTAGGEWCAQARRCPHLDWDLAEARVVGDELVCPGHGWSFDIGGHAGKRNERGRLDPKGTVTTLAVRVHDDTIEVRRR